MNAAGLTCKIIVNTHGHVDHTGANRALREATGAIIAIGEEDASSLEDPTRNLSSAFSSFQEKQDKSAC